MSHETEKKMWKTSGNFMAKILFMATRQTQRKSSIPFTYNQRPCCENRQTMRQTPDGTRSSSLMFDIEASSKHKSIFHVVTYFKLWNRLIKGLERFLFIMNVQSGLLLTQPAAVGFQVSLHHLIHFLRFCQERRENLS